MLESTVPPADVGRVGIFMQPLKRYQEQVWFIRGLNIMFLSQLPKVTTKVVTLLNHPFRWKSRPISEQNSPSLSLIGQYFLDAFFWGWYCRISMRHHEPTFPWIPMFDPGFPPSCWTPHGSKRSFNVRVTWQSCRSGANSLRSTQPSRFGTSKTPHSVHLTFRMHYPPPERRPWTTNTSTTGITGAGLLWTSSLARSINSWGSHRRCLLTLPLFNSKVKMETRGFSADWFM